MSPAFVLAIWLDFDIDERENALDLAVRVALLLPKNGIKIKLFSRYIHANKIKDLFKNKDIFIDVYCVYSNENQFPFSRLKEADCWFFPDVFEMDPPPAWVPIIAAVPDEHADEFENAESDFQLEVFGGGTPTRQSFASGASLCLAFSEKMAAILSKNLGIPAARIRTVDLSANEAGEELGDLVREARSAAALDQVGNSARCSRPWPLKEAFFLPADGVPEVFLFLPTIYPGGIWQASRDLISDLVEINRHRGCLKLTLGVPDAEGDEEYLQQIALTILLDRFELMPISLYESKRILGKQKLGYDHDFYCFTKGCEQHALRADAWFALTDRFRYPLLPARPYGVMIYDVIQKHAPETFPPRFFESLEQGMKPSVQAAQFVITCGATVRDDVVDFYGVEPDRVKMFPIATDPLARFAGKSPRHVSLPNPSFILQVTNMAPHKGVLTALRAQARLKQSMGPSTPALVICGSGTELLVSKQPGSEATPYITKVRKAIEDLDLRAGRDFHCLGFVREEELLDLYQRAILVLNAARYDLGTLCAIEAGSFGKPVVSSRYPAIEEMAERFSLPIHFFQVDDDLDLARRLEMALESPSLSETQIRAIRSSLDQSHLSHRHYAEKIYQILLEMGEKGRSSRR